MSQPSAHPPEQEETDVHQDERATRAVLSRARRRALRLAHSRKDPADVAAGSVGEELALGFEEHLDETQQHVKNVELAFEKLGEKPTVGKCPGIEGITPRATKSSQQHRKEAT